jgi:hypothetical protein
MSTTVKRKSFKQINKIIREILEEFPSDLPIKVIKKKLTGYFGYITKSKKYYYIYIDSRLEESIMLDTVIHEIAHALTVLDQHSAEWGRAYSKIYRFYEKHYQ